MLKSAFKNSYLKAIPKMALRASFRFSTFSKKYSEHIKDTDYKRINKIVKKFKYPLIKIKDYPGFRTKSLRAAQDPCPITGSIIPPIYPTSSFAMKTPTTMYSEYEYARGSHPTRDVLEKVIASLEFGKYGVVASSGLAANSLVFLDLKEGDHMIAVDDTYGGT